MDVVNYDPAEEWIRLVIQIHTPTSTQATYTYYEKEKEDTYATLYIHFIYQNPVKSKGKYYFENCYTM